MKSLLINFHSLVSVWVLNPTDDFGKDLERHFKRFIVEGVPRSERLADIILEPMDELPVVTEEQMSMYRLYGCTVLNSGQGLALALLHKGVPDLLFSVSDSTRIAYRVRRGNQRRIYGMLLYALQLCLSRKGALLVHGAVVEKAGQSLILSGHRGSGKTQLLLTFLDNGWNFLSDDKFILHDGTAYLFETRVSLHDHLFSRLGWLNRGIGRPLHSQQLLRLRVMLRQMAFRTAPERVAQVLGKLLNRPKRHEIDRLVKSCQVRISTKPNAVFILFHGQNVVMDRVSNETAVTALSIICELLFSDTAIFNSMLRLYTSSHQATVRELLETNLAKVSCYRVAIPAAMEPEAVYNEILKCYEVL